MANKPKKLPKAKNIALAQYVKFEIDDLKKFQVYWTSQHEKDPAFWPATMPYGEWWEQYIAWSQSMSMNE